MRMLPAGARWLERSGRISWTRLEHEHLNAGAAGLATPNGPDRHHARPHPDDSDQPLRNVDHVAARHLLR